MFIKKIYLYATIFAIFISLSLVILDELETLFSWWLVFLFLLPPLIWSLKNKYITLQVFCLLSFFSQAINLPVFYLYRDSWNFAHVKPFYFTATEALPILAKVSFFIIFVIIFFKALIIIFSFLKLPALKEKNTIQESIIDSSRSAYKKYDHFDLKKNSKTKKFTILIILLISLLIPLNLWSYSIGIGITGVEAPRLPFRLVGIIFYLVKYVTPLLLGYLYIQTKRGWFLMFIYITYALIAGLCSVSKGIVILIMLPVVILAWHDNRYLLSIISSLSTLVVVFIASAARAYVHTVSAGVTGANVSNSIGTLLLNVISNPDSRLRDSDFLLRSVDGLAARVEGFQNLVMAYYYDSAAVLGGGGFILRMIWRGWATVDADAHHLEWQGNILPEGFYNGGSLLSHAIILGNISLIYVIMGSFVVAVTFVLIENITNFFLNRFNAFYGLRTPIIFFIVSVYFTETSINRPMVFILILLFLLGCLPKKTDY